ncbi:unnamed protein product [Caenorhabditis bovis]|uniref:STAS domain-containing protein n=1 Tax=Caenorhabditis bovis TaxID=2654633 RepID=A0A8S1FDM5_9PELO|nr:unnamed protein product [Caenorhabditis bovis]
MYKRVAIDSTMSLQNIRSRSTQTLSPEPESVGERTRFQLSPLTESTINEELSRIDLYNRTNVVKINRDILNQAAKWKKSEWIQFIMSMIPITQWLSSYNWKSDLIIDVLGGTMISVMSVPQSLAYGMLVGVPPSYGLITGIIGPLVYATFGTSRHSSPGAFAIVSLMVGGAVESFAQGFYATDDQTCCRGQSAPVSQTDAIAISTSITLLVGIFQILFGIMNAGLLSVWLSDHLVQGLTSGAAIHVLTSQIKSITNIRTLPTTSEPFQLVQFYLCFFHQMHTAQYQSVLCSMICFGLLALSAYVIDPQLRRRKVPVKFPMELIIVIGSTLVVALGKVNIPTVGHVEGGIPAPKFPPMTSAGSLATSAMSIAVISFVIHIALCKLVSKRLNYVINPNQEWLALGLMHTTSSFFGCFAGGSSLGRTMMQVNCGTKTQLSTIVCSIVLTIFVLGAAKYIFYLPKAVLAVIVVFAMKDLFFQTAAAFDIRRKSFFDFLIFIVTFTSVLILNVNFGLVVGVAFALLTVVFRSQWADSTLLGRIKGTNHFRGLSHYGAAVEIPGIKVFRFDAPLYFANSELFLSRIHSTCGINPIIVKGKIAEEEKKNREAEKKRRQNDLEAPLVTKDETQLEIKGERVKKLGSDRSASRKEEFEITQLTHIILDCSSIPYIDLMGKDSLMQVFTDYKSIDIEVLFANTKETVRQILDSTDFFEKVPPNRMFVSLTDAVNQAKLEQQGKYNGDDQSGRTILKPAAIAQPIAKSVAQKTAPLNNDTVLPRTQSTSLLTGIDNSLQEHLDTVSDTRMQQLLIHLLLLLLTTTRGEVLVDVSPNSIAHLFKRELSAIHDRLIRISPPPFHSTYLGLELKVDHIQLVDLHMPRISYELIAPDVINLKLLGGSARLLGQYSAQYKTKREGQFEFIMTDFHFSMPVRRSTPNYQLTPDAACSLELDESRVVMTPAFPEQITKNIRTSMLHTINDQVCKEAEKFVERFSKRLANSVKLLDISEGDHPSTVDVVVNLHNPPADEQAIRISVTESLINSELAKLSTGAETRFLWNSVPELAEHLRNSEFGDGHIESSLRDRPTIRLADEILVVLPITTTFSRVAHALFNVDTDVVLIMRNPMVSAPNADGRIEWSSDFELRSVEIVKISASRKFGAFFATPLDAKIEANKPFIENILSKYLRGALPIQLNGLTWNHSHRLKHINPDSLTFSIMPHFAPPV